MRALEIITYVFAVLAALVLFAGESAANGAPQEAAAASLAAAMVIIPYCVSATAQRRAILRRLEESRDEFK